MTKTELIDAMIDFHELYNPYDVMDCMSDEGWDHIENYMENILLYKDKTEMEYDCIKYAAKDLDEGRMKDLAIMIRDELDRRREASYLDDID